MVKADMVKGSPEILVVDDEPQLCTALLRILKMEGYKVRTASDGETALGLVKEKQPDVVLLDVIMPGMDGREICRRLRECTTGTQVIYFTAKSGAFHPEAMKELRHEADAFLAKPASSKQILSQVSSVLQSVRQLQL